MSKSDVILSVREANKNYRTHSGFAKVLDNVSFDICKGDSVGLIGESGSGKSTLARCILMLDKFSSGSCIFNGIDLCSMAPKDLQEIRKDIQIVFQDSSSLNPQHTVEEIILEPLEIHYPHLSNKHQKMLYDLIEHVGINSSILSRFPHELSGGQKQRVSIARSIILKPKLLVCDEPFSALDLSIQAQIVNLIKSLKKDFDLTFLIISHDLSMVRHICDKIIVMYNGSIVEIADKEVIYSNPKHPYTKMLIDSIPILDPFIERNREKIIIEGEHSSIINDYDGCSFEKRCRFAHQRCIYEKPELKGSNHKVSCHMFDTDIQL